MTREDTKERIGVMQAYVDGKEIEFYDADGEKWVTTESPLWNYNIRYRVRLMPKYRPFESSEECWNEMAKHEPFGWVKDLEGGYVHLRFVDGNPYWLNDRFEQFTFVDGKPFGIIENQSK